MYNKFRLLLIGILLLGNFKEANCSYTDGDFNLAGNWIWDNKTRTAWCNSTTTSDSSDIHSILSLANGLQLALGVIVAPVFKERLLDLMCNGIGFGAKWMWGKISCCRRSNSVNRVSSDDMLLNDLVLNVPKSIKFSLQQIDEIFTQREKWHKQPIVRESQENYLIGYRYLGGSETSLFEFLIVEGGFSNISQESSCLLSKNVKTTPFLISKHPAEDKKGSSRVVNPRHILNLTDWDGGVALAAATEDQQEFTQFKENFLNSLSLISQPLFEESFWKHQYFSQGNLGHDLDFPHIVYFNKNAQTLHIFFNRAQSPGANEESDYIKIQKLR